MLRVNPLLFTGFLLLFFVLLPGLLHVQAQIEPGGAVSDTSQIELREADPDRINRYREDSAFDYDTDPERSTSFWRILLLRFFSFLGRLFGSETGNMALRIVFIVIFTGVLLVILNQILKGNMGAVFSGKSASKNLRLQLEEEHIEQVDLQGLILQALQNRNYKEAVRLTYHKALQDLSEAGVIQWAWNKTNQEYLNEIGSHPSRKPFGRLTFFYDYTEYGDFDIDSAGYARVEEIYIEVKKRVESNV